LNNKIKAYLTLEDGSIYTGYSFGSKEYVEGEVVFNTGMTGYQEVLTDPSYSGQIVIMTYPQIGNYGTIKEDSESGKIQVRGFVVKEHCDFPNNYRGKGTVSEYLSDNNISGIEGIDTRAITRKIRNYGTMKGFISTTRLPDNKMIDLAKNAEDISKIDLVMQVTARENQVFPGDGLHIGIMDYGVKLNMARIFNAKGHKVTIIPAGRDYDDIKTMKLDLLFLSNGPGDPKMATYAIKLARNFVNKIPIAGICLGHQIIGLALGADTYKLKFGHRGANHPVQNLLTNKVMITTQNHGYAVDKDSLPKGVEVTHINLNDNTIEGFRDLKNKIYCVQFHPEAAPGPFDCHGIFDEFLGLVG
jgi:carbamoyl-phosphate synthase small subunit